MNRIALLAYDTESRKTYVLFMEGARLVVDARVEDVTTEDLVEWVERATLPSASKLGWLTKEDGK